MSRDACSIGYGRRFPAPETDVTCPVCNDTELLARYSCLDVRFHCQHCATYYDLADLAPKLDDEAFGKLEACLGNRYSNRI